ncbi:sodium/phosphate symporter [Halegenticoccus tardaugens]|uniref:sodium/phosphate symporter n=1 Tax=Halegenticoccus tardaugens TaxID=2071624 RepID=UPI00100A753E|nr:sodium/phosphate symporter [Halegenticoccus tardaugens]
MIKRRSDHVATERRDYLLVSLVVFAVAVGMRTLILHWSPLPSTLDGFEYAAYARDAIAGGQFPLSRIRADHLGFASFLTASSVVLDGAPVRLIQPLIALVGAVTCLVAVALVRRAARNLGWPSREVRWAAVLVGFSLAVEGLYLRRTGVTDEEVIGLLYLPLLALALHRALASSDRRWLGIVALFMLLFPVTHTFSTLMAGTVSIGVLAAHLLRTPTIRTAAVGFGLVSGFWGYFAAYYWVAERTPLTVPYTGRILSYPGLFVAWLIILVIGIAWFLGTSDRLRRTTFLVPVTFMFAVLVANAFRTIFPGTVRTPLPLLALVLLLLVPVALASRSLPVLSWEPAAGVVLLALLAAPIVMTAYSLTAALTPEFFGTVMRTQTFAHFPVLALAALATVRYVSPRLSPPTRFVGRPAVRRGLLVLLVVSLTLTAPIAFVNLDTLSFPSTTNEAEFAAVSFAASNLDGEWSADHSITTIGANYYPTRTKAAIEPTATWLSGGPTPACPTISQRSWTTTGAHLFPASPETVTERTYAGWTSERNLVYSATGRDPVSISASPGHDGETCQSIRR